jgi:hypothetical protein
VIWRRLIVDWLVIVDLGFSLGWQVGGSRPSAIINQQSTIKNQSLIRNQ